MAEVLVSPNQYSPLVCALALRRRQLAYFPTSLRDQLWPNRICLYSRIILTRGGVDNEWGCNNVYFDFYGNLSTRYLANSSP